MKASRNMVNQAEEYLAFRRRLGYALVSDGKELMLFARHADKIGHHRSVTKELAIEWAKLPEGANQSYWAERLRIGAFFLDEDAEPLNYRGVLYRFMQLREKFGWRNASTGRPPRIHDLRHAFAARRLLEWYRDGHSIEEHILYLSVYLGHACVSDTYWYLTAVPELMELVSERFHTFAYAKGGDRS